jgi:hypothetical protein
MTVTLGPVGIEAHPANATANATASAAPSADLLRFIVTLL